MGFLELLSIAVALAMDAFAVSLCKGLSMTRLNHMRAVIIAAFFGFFQAMMPLIGWALGTRFSSYITSFDHWVAFVLLLFIGIKMIREALGRCDECMCKEDRLDYKELTVLAVATSIDALAVGITLAFLNVQILPSCAVIGLVTFVLCALGVVIGNKFGTKYKSRAEIFGGAILIIIGLKILVDHIFV